MNEFEDYIFNPESVEESLPEVREEDIAPVKDIDRTDWTGFLDFAVEMERQTIKIHQPNLHRLSETLAGHFRIKHNGSPAILDSIQYGFAIGKMVASMIYGMPRRQIGSGDEDRELEEARLFRSYHRDMEKDTLAIFEEADSLPLDMLLDAIERNTEERTSLLREMVDYHLMLERRREELEAATTLGAVVCYTVIAFERERVLKATLDNLWEVRKGNQSYENNLSLEEMIALTPASARREVNGLRRARWYWPRFKKSDPVQTS